MRTKYEKRRGKKGVLHKNVANLEREFMEWEKKEKEGKIKWNVNVK